MSNELNLAKRPFVDTRPVTAAMTVLVIVVVILSAISFRTIARYLDSSRGTTIAIAALRREIAETEERRLVSQADLARFDLEELGASAEDANLIARRRSFSWTRFLSRLEMALPSDLRVTTVALSKETDEQSADSRRKLKDGAVNVELALISRDPLGLSRTIRALYASPYFDHPIPRADVSPERGNAQGRQITLGVLYFDAGKKP